MAGTTRALETSVVFRPKPYEVDFTGILSNTVAVRWMEDLRVLLMWTHFPDFPDGEPQNVSVIVSANIRYHRPIRYGDTIVGTVWLANMARSRWEVSFEFLGEASDEPRISGSQVGAFVCYKTGVPVPVPERFLKYASQIPSNGSPIAATLR